MHNKISIFWFRRDLRLEDNTALHFALNSGNVVLPIFIFDEEIIDKLPKDDSRITFIYDTLKELDTKLKAFNSSIQILIGKPTEVWENLTSKHKIASVFFNKDYEPYAINRDEKISNILYSKGIDLFSYKDHVIFEKNEIVKKDKTPYTVYTPYKNEWLKKFDPSEDIKLYDCDKNRSAFYNLKSNFPSMENLGFKRSIIKVKPYNLGGLSNYDNVRDYPALNKTSSISPYLRFGLLSIRQVVKIALNSNKTFLSELIWREFFIQILYHFPKVVTQNFKSKYNNILWRNNEYEFEMWCKGQTGYPIVDAGMRELNQTGYMHNRVRMITAGFLCKHLLIDWRWGEAYFAEKLLDFELASNNGNWQWSAGSGCDSAPYFRIFNPMTQIKKFDKNFDYIQKWVPEFQELTYPKPIVDHKFARERCLMVYKDALKL